MGCSMVHPSVKVESNEIEDFSEKIEFPVTKHEIHLLKESWGQVSQSWNIIVASTFQRWLTSYPELKKIFKDLDKDLKDHEIVTSPALLRHASKMGNIVECVLDNLKNEQKLIHDVIQLGILHHKVFGANQKHTTAMVNGIIRALYTECQLDVETRNAWSSLLIFFADMLKTGMRIAIKEEAQMAINISLET